MDLPNIKIVRINEGLETSGSFLDNEFLFHYIDQGNWTFRLESELYHIYPGDVILLAPNILHIVKPVGKENLTQFVIHFELSHVHPIIKNLPMVLTLSNEDQKKVKELFLKLYKEWIQQEKGYYLITSGILSEILGIYIRNENQDKSFKRIRTKNWLNIEKAIQYIHKNYQYENLSIKDISYFSGLSLNYFCAQFKKHTGFSPNKYLNLYRIEKARDLLLNGNFNCTETAYQTGFSSIHAFSKVFSKIMKCSPTEWIKNIQLDLS